MRRERGLLQKAFAALIGTSQGYICDIEKGKKSPGSEFLVSLRRVLGVDLNLLLTGEAHVMKTGSKNDINRRYLRKHTFR
ncbi:MAG: helix-turn-helix transcriptional regulator [Desulfuromonadales bacterium]